VGKLSMLEEDTVGDPEVVEQMSSWTEKEMAWMQKL
jgi:hypothetical protein